MMLADFHFLRPEWLLAFIPAAALAALLWRRLRTGHTDWARVVDPHLLAHLATRGGRRMARWPVAVLLAGWSAAILALAGPTWERIPQPASDGLEPVVAVVSLGSTMNARDESPTRLGAVRYKVADVLTRMRGGEVGLVVYADRPFVAAPLTQDGRVVGQMLPELDTDLMRAVTSRPDLAIGKAVELLKGAGAPAGRILLFADGAGDDAAATRAAAAAAAAAGFRVSVLGAGKAGAGSVVPADAAGLAAVAAAGAGVFSLLAPDNSDLDALLAEGAGAAGGAASGGSVGFRADAWADMGPFLIVVVLLLAPLAFRRGWIAILFLAIAPVLFAPPPARAAQGSDWPQVPDWVQVSDWSKVSSWDDLWARPDQQGASAFGREDYTAAVQRFEDPAWRASALYKAGDYEGAAAAFARIPGADYNRGNALARAWHLEEAVAAYDAALAARPDHADARTNRDLVQGLIDKRKKDADKQNQDKDGGGSGGGGDGGGGDAGLPGGQDKAKPDPQAPGTDPNPQGNPAAGGTVPPSRPLPGPAPLPPRRPSERAAGSPQPPQPPQPPQQSQPGQATPPPPSAQKPDDATPPPLTSASPPASSPPQDGPVAVRSVTVPADQIPSSLPLPLPDQRPEPTAPPSLSDDPQSREQMLRSVPDDPGGLLRARIKAHYRGIPARIVDGN